MNDEVSVAELLVREGWGDRSEPGQSRWRVVAVMLAVVLGCGAAAVLVALGGGKGTQDASPVDQIQVIPFPQRTTGLGGADQATDSPSDGGVGGGTGGDVETKSGEPRATVTEVPGTDPTEPTTTDSASPTTTSTTGAPGTTVTTTTNPGGHVPPPTTTPAPPRPSCLLIICW